MVLILTLLAKFKDIQYDMFSINISLISILVTIQNTIFSIVAFGGSIMITVIEMVGIGVCGVTNHSVNVLNYVVSIDVLIYTIHLRFKSSTLYQRGPQMWSLFYST